MQKIKRCSVYDSIEEPCIVVGEGGCIFVGEPSDKLLELQNEEHLVLCELKHLQGKSEAEIEEALQKEEAVWQYQHICVDANALPEAYFERIWYRHQGMPVQIAETERLLIRESIPEDAKAFQQLYADEAVQAFLEMPPIEQGWETYIAQYAKNQYGFYEYGMWSVVEKESGEVIGRMGLELQASSAQESEVQGSNAKDEKLALGYALLPKYRGKGYAYEACLAILEYCKECGYATEVFVKIDNKNINSRNLFQKLQKYSRIALREM